ncbi:hypothetical protein G5V57_20900 [Nordella sp. HKS 07]|uniref:hypothetical protein n=1 Tax=Nordella sp. HKS 07 TaxID=2712222 RepID=UPI0013E14C8D|nr:hypothetical protein [Nordella sp. HKS 07]QIG49964.1 hypothetical protein G5V57_20900 [Nordella sp. HKS 07]
MKLFDLTPLLKQVEPHRNEVVEINGVSMPKSAAMLMSVFATQTDYFARAELSMCAISECTLANNTAAAVKLAQAHHQEFRNDTSLMILSEALIENNELEAGFLHAKKALELAIRKQSYVNYAAGNLVRLSVKTGSVETVNEAMEALIDSTQLPCNRDCVLESDWCDKAEALGADMESISWIRSVAAKQMKHLKRYRRRLARKS